MKGFLRPAARGVLHLYRALPKRPVFDIVRLSQKYGIEPRGVLHLGANDGQEAEAYQRCGFRRVVWVEGYRKAYDLLKAHLRSFPGQIAYQLLISDVDGERLKFRVSENLRSSTVFAVGKAFREDFPQVSFVDSEELSAQRLDSFFAENEVDLTQLNVLIVDLEGSELKALRSMGGLLDRFDWVGIEISVTENFLAGPTLQDIDRFLMEAGFRRLETVMGSSSGDALYQRSRVSKFARAKMFLSAHWYNLGYYRLYRNLIVKGIKRLAGDEPTPPADS